MLNDVHELSILEAIAREPADVLCPQTTQAGLADQLGVSVGSVNWILKRLVDKGYVKVTHLQRRKLHYFLTPAGLAQKFRLTRSYMDVSLRMYRELRQAARQVLADVRRAGYAALCITAQDEATEILRLTCLEEGFPVEQGGQDQLPIVNMHGTGFVVTWPANTASEIP
jgi:DNA-binding MarR family transcriptional regulator